MLKKSFSQSPCSSKVCVCARTHTRACVRMHGLMHMYMCLNHVMSSLIISMTDFFSHKKNVDISSLQDVSAHCTLFGKAVRTCKIFFVNYS